MLTLWGRRRKGLSSVQLMVLVACSAPGHYFNSLRPKQNGRLFADDTFKRILLNENIRISTKNSLKFVPKGLINNIPALVLIMAWRRPGDKPLSEPMLVRSLTHICVIWPQWVKQWWYIVDSTNFNLDLKHITVQSRKCIRKCLQDGGHFVQASMYKERKPPTVFIKYGTMNKNLWCNPLMIRI